MGFKLTNKNILHSLHGNVKPSALRFDDPDKTKGPEKVLSAKELREKMLEERKAEILAGRKVSGEGPEKVLTNKELREKMLADRKAKILASRNAPEEVVEETPVEEVVEEIPVEKKTGGPADVRAAKPVEAGDGWTYVDGNARTANIRTRNNWKPTGVGDEDIWIKNENDLQSKYDNYEEFTKEAQAWRDAQVETQNRNDWEEHWSKEYWSPYEKDKGSMDLWLEEKIGDRIPKEEWNEAFTSSKNQREFVAWARENAPYLLSKGTGRRTGGTKRGKTGWN